MNKDVECITCHRLHDIDQPCPLRIANAYTMQYHALDLLTEADKEWMARNSKLSVLDVLEDAIADMM